MEIELREDGADVGLDRRGTEYELAGESLQTTMRRTLSSRSVRSWTSSGTRLAFLAAAPDGAGRMLLGLLAGSGLRIDEALSLRWRNVHLLGTGTLSVVASKPTLAFTPLT